MGIALYGSFFDPEMKIEKHTILTIIFNVLFLLPLFTYAQGNKNADKNAQFGWYIGIPLQYTQVDHKSVYMPGIDAGLLYKQKIAIGARIAGFGNWNESLLYSNMNNGAGAYLEGFYGGLLIEWKYKLHQKAHITFPVMAGFGLAFFRARNSWITDNPDKTTVKKTLDKNRFGIVEPGVEFEWNVNDFFIIASGVSYRYTSAIQFEGLSKGLLNGISAGLKLKFGIF